MGRHTWYTVNELLQIPFSLRPLEEKLDIVRKGRPAPPLPNLQTKLKSKTQQYVRYFSVSHYENVEWLAGCETSNKLFCWPCLLFSDKNEVWNKHGYADLNHLSASEQKHSKSQMHMQCIMKLKLFGKQRVDLLLDDQRRNEHNEQVKTNRALLIRIIDAICFLANQGLSFRGHEESASSLNKGNFLEFLHVLKKYDPLLEIHINSSSVFRGNSSSIQNDIIMVIADTVRDKIKQEIKSAPYVSIMLDETSEIENKSQLSTVLRYVNDSTICERFLGFTDVSANRTADGLFVHVQQVIDEFEIASKLVGQTYDGACVMSGHVNGLQSKVLAAYPNALFIPCHAHDLNLVLQKNVSVIKECKIYFQTLSGLSAFFSKSSERTNALWEFVQKKLPSVAPTRWNFTSRLSHTVKEYRCQLSDFFENVVKHSEDWDSEAVIESRGFLAFMQEFKTMFLLEVFSKLFTYTDILYNVLQTKYFDILYCAKKVNDTKFQLQHEQEHSFPSIWNNTLAQNNIQQDKSKRHCPDRAEQENNYRRLYLEITDCIINQINFRFSQLEKLEYFHLLHNQKYKDYKKRFPDSLLKKIWSAYGKKFDYNGLKNELSVLYSSAEFRGKDVHELVAFIHENGLSSGFSEVYKLAKLILTIPCTASSVERSFSALRRINTYLQSTQTQERLSDPSMLSIEKELVRKLREGGAFYDTVIEKFASQERRIELMFK